MPTHYNLLRFEIDLALVTLQTGYYILKVPMQANKE